MGKSTKRGGTGFIGYTLLALIAIGLILVIIGMCTGVLTATGEAFGMTTVKHITLFGEEWETFAKVDIGNTFLLVSFIVAIVGLLVLVTDAILRLFVKKDIKIIRILGVLVTLVGAILVIAAGETIVGDCNDIGGAAGNKLEVLAGLFGISYQYGTDAGVWFGFIGGLLGAVGGTLPLFKAFR